MMENDYHKSGLYRWQRQSKPRVHSRSQKVASDDIQAWMQKVEEASSKATEAVLGPVSSSPYTRGRQRGRDAVEGLSDQARIQDEAYTEAQDLLSEWLTQKVTLHDRDGEEDPDLAEDPWRKENLGLEARKKWDNLLSGNLEELGIDTTPTVFQRQKSEDDPYANLYDLEEDEAVSTVMRNMLDKELVKETFRKDLGFDDGRKSHDPRTKMALRHQQVKENRAKREEELKQRRKDADAKKEARLTARQIVMKEEKIKEMKSKKEEQEIRKEMARLRKEMQETQRKEAEEKHRRQQEMVEKARLAREELERQQALEREEMLTRQHELSERRKAEMAQRELAKARLAANNLRILHGHFTAWYDIVLHRRLWFGKARALADWRLTLRVWNAWRSYARSQRITIETKQHEQNVVEENRKAMAAKKHHYLHQLRRHFLAWRDFVSQEQDKRNLEQAQETTRSKMMNLLSAVADGSLWTDRQESEEKVGDRGRSDSARHHGKEKRGLGAGHSGAHNGNTELDDMFNQPARRKAWQENNDFSPLPSSRADSALSSVSTTQHRGQGQKMPIQAWQITRKHAHLSEAELAKLMGGEANAENVDEGSQVASEHSDVKIRRRFGTQPWMNRHFTVNNMEHRFTAQQKLLHEQQSEIKEQKRMIQELMFAQQQQGHQERLAQLSSEKSSAMTEGKAQARGKEQKRKSEGNNKTGVDKPTASSSGPSNVPSAKSPGSSDHSTGQNTQRSEVSSAWSGQGDSVVSTTMSATTANTNNTKYLRVLKNMEDRAAERARIKAERDEKRRQEEEERLERLKAEEEQLKKQAEEEKLARVQAYREKKRLEKQREQEKQKEMERQRELNSKADMHYQRALMKFRVLLPMKKLVLMAQEKMDIAKRHHNQHVLRQAVATWKSYTDELTAEKKQLADDLHGYIAVRRCFRSWKNFKYRMVFLERRAERHHKETILPKLFEAWRQYTGEEKVVAREKMRQAQEFYPASLLRLVFRAWRRLPLELRREAEREKMRAEMRKKVADLLPDYNPSISVSQSTDSVL